MFVNRAASNPIITPGMVKPSVKGFKVDCTFNAGVIDINGETLMLLRVAESMPGNNENTISVPLLVNDEGSWKVQIKTFDKNDSRYDFSDPREIALKEDPTQIYLTSLSHIRIARSTDGEKFVIDEHPFIFPSSRYEVYGCEDPRITLIDGDYYINYSSVSDLGITTSLVRTTDFKSIEKLGIIFAPDNRDVCFFPKKINGFYWALHRPAPLHFGTPEIWLARSPDMLHWGGHLRLAGCSDGDWDQMKIGGGAPLIKTDKGWLQIYHGVDKTQRYCLGALLIDIDDPTKVIARMSQPLIEPKADYEIEGFFGNVVFCCGALIKENELHIYYGASDEVMALAKITLDALWHQLSV